MNKVKTNGGAETTDYEAPALSKGLEILELLAGAADRLSQADIARALGRTTAEQFRMLAVLERHGYVNRDAGGLYGLTLKVFALGQRVKPVEKLLAAARGPMRRFAEATGAGCHLSVRDGERLLVVAQADGPAAVRLTIEVGAYFPLLPTASGRLLLALGAETSAPWEDLLEWKTLTPTRQRAVAREMADIRVAEVSRAEGETVAGVRDVVVPVTGPTGVCAALACSELMTAAGGSSALIERALRDAAAEIGVGLGDRGRGDLPPGLESQRAQRKT